MGLICAGIAWIGKQGDVGNLCSYKVRGKQNAIKIQVNGQMVAADNIVVATGAESLIPDIPGLSEAGYITHKEAIYLDALPARLAVIGGGPLGVEFAQMFGRFGVEVSLIEAEPHLLPHDDPELTEILENIFREEGINLHLQAQLTAVQPSPEGKELTLRYENDYEQSITVDEILMAVGRKPSLAALRPAEVPGAIIIGQTSGLIKILSGEKDEILGAHILAAHAGDLIAPLLVAMQGNLPVSAAAETIYPYPTLAAGIGYATQQMASIFTDK